MLRNETKAVNANTLISYVRTVDQQIDATLIPERLLTLLSRSFAAIALLLACVGLYGVMTYNVSRRTREIGLHLALGAVPREILVRVLRDAMTVCAIGLILGLAMAFATTRLLSTFLFGLTPHDPTTLTATALILLTITLVAGIVPARRAASTNPIQALRRP
jgi:ABC-type antimicrobial peptide transport system permease subunit